MPDTADYAGRDLEAMSFATRYHRHIVQIFRPYLGSRIAEVGAGDGAVTELLAELSPRHITAIEPSPRMFDALVQRTDALGAGRITALAGHLPDFAGRLRKEKPDSFVYINVLEHIEDDVAEMKRVHELLAPGDHLCIFVPALPGLYSEFDRGVGHFRRYRKRELEDKCRAAGFSIRQSRYFDFLGIVPWWIRFRLLKGSTLSPRAVKLYDRIGVPIIATVESVLAPPIGKNLLLIARRA